MAPIKSKPTKAQKFKIFISAPTGKQPNKPRKIVTTFPVGVTANEATERLFKSLKKIPYVNTRRHVKTLCKEYKKNRNPSVSERQRISDLTGLSVPQISDWFYRRRLAENRAQNEAEATHGDPQTAGDNFSEGNQQELKHVTAKNNSAEQKLGNVVAPSTSTSSTQINAGSAGGFRLPQTDLNVFLSSRTKYLFDPKHRTPDISVIKADLNKIRDLSNEDIKNILTDRWKAKAKKLFKLATEDSTYNKLLWTEAEKLAQLLDKLKLFSREQLDFLEVCRLDFMEILEPGGRTSSRMVHRVANKVVIPFSKLFIYSWVTFQDGCRLNLDVALDDFTKVTKIHNDRPWFIPSVLNQC